MFAEDDLKMAVKMLVIKEVREWWQFFQGTITHRSNKIV
jgi:hypothetical protein